MSKLDRSEWYDLTRATTWSPSYVTEEQLFPESLSGGRGIPLEDWSTYDEPYKVTYPEYVSVQREKDAGVYSVKAALERDKFVERAEPGWLSILQAHYGGIALGEYAASLGEARMARFAKAPGNRNMATFGALDETRHGQIQLFFPHANIKRSHRWDWAQKALHTQEWAATASRSLFDDIILARDAVSISIMLTFAFETGFTNMQFLGLAADAAEAGDHTFASLISSVQTDEARHAQQGGPALKILIEHGKKDEAQRLVDIAFWRSWRLFSVLTGPMMDYYTPLADRQQSFKEFMQEWIVDQFDRSIKDLGLDSPWYWDIFLRELNDTHHGMHLGVWYWRPTVWWNPAAGASVEERDWLEEKYPGWNDTWGRCWDVITDNALRGRFDKTLPETLPVVCAMNQLPILGCPGKSDGTGWGLRTYTLEYGGRKYHFGSEVDRWIFEQEPHHYAGHKTLVDNFLEGAIQPATLEGALAFMGLTPEVFGEDATDFAWIEGFRELRKAS